MDSPLAGDSLSSDTLRHELERLLRVAGVPLVEDGDLFDLPHAPALRVCLTMLRTGQGVGAYSLTLRLVQSVFLRDEDRSAASAVTWEDGEIGLVSASSAKAVRKSLERLVESFAEDFANHVPSWHS